MSCPYGLENDPYPGSCGRYIDQNQNQICDLSETQVPSSSSLAGTSSFSFPAPTLNPLLISCFALPIIIYSFTSKNKLFWNLVLLISFVFTAATSLLYIFNIISPVIFNLHLYIGTIMLSVSFCHLFWHFRYYLLFFKLRHK